jgi:hypothetical protein
VNHPIDDKNVRERTDRDDRRNVTNPPREPMERKGITPERGSENRPEGPPRSESPNDNE